MRGLTIFFTGLPSSGKSTIAMALAEEFGCVTVLDGDEVRKVLSSGLGFSKADRDTNIRRIGWVAAEVTKHGGVAICCPIAPYESVREEVRKMVSQYGDFLLVYVSTPLEVCEKRDVKGLYIKARSGALKEFTGVSDPYEIPDRPNVILDTSKTSVEGCVQKIMGAVVHLSALRTEP